MKKNKYKIHAFVNHIYPRVLYVVVNDSATFLNQQFENRENPDAGIRQDDYDCKTAITFRCTEHITGNYGVCVAFRKREFMTIREMAHNAVHVTSSFHKDLCMAMGFDVEEDETFAYITGWAADCMNQVKTNKFR